MFRVVEADEGQISQIAKLEQEIFSDAWSERSLRDTFRQPHAKIFGAWQGNELSGYVILYYVLEEGEIARIAVGPPHRRQGAAKALLAKTEEFCAENGIERLLLDVRESNAGAIAFYRECGFAEDGIRKGFYTAPAEDAILMSRRTGR